MTRQMARTDEGTMTYLTFIWFGTGMCSLMDDGCFVPGKCFITMATRIWSLARIYLTLNDIFKYISARSNQFKKSGFDWCLRVRLWMANVFEPANDRPHSLHTYGLKNIIHENYSLFNWNVSTHFYRSPVCVLKIAKIEKKWVGNWPERWANCLLTANELPHSRFARTLSNRWDIWMVLEKKKKSFRALEFIRIYLHLICWFSYFRRYVHAGVSPNCPFGWNACDTFVSFHFHNIRSRMRMVVRLQNVEWW